jgi:hypothetical protein
LVWIPDGGPWEREVLSRELLPVVTDVQGGFGISTSGNRKRMRTCTCTVLGSLEGRFTKRDDQGSIPGVVHTESGVVKDHSGVAGTAEPWCVFELLVDGITDDSVVVVAERR